MIHLLQTKTADTAHMGIFASVTRPLSWFLGGTWGRGYLGCGCVCRGWWGLYTLLGGMGSKLITQTWKEGSLKLVNMLRVD